MRYKYRAQDSQNQQVSGEINADSEREAMRQLRRRDLDVLELQEIAERSVAQASGKAKQRDVLVALHELTTLLESGVSLIEAVESLADSAYLNRWRIQLITRCCARVFAKRLSNCAKGLHFLWL